MKRQGVTRAKNSSKRLNLKNAPAQGLTAPHGDCIRRGDKKKIFSFTAEVYPSGNIILFFESVQDIETGQRKIKTLHKPSKAMLSEIRKAIVLGNAQHTALISDRDAQEWDKLRKKTVRDKNLSYLFVK